MRIENLILTFPVVAEPGYFVINATGEWGKVTKIEREGSVTTLEIEVPISMEDVDTGMRADHYVRVAHPEFGDLDA